MSFVAPRESVSDLLALCRKWHDENRAMADDLFARRIVHTERIAGEWCDVTMDDAERHARVAAELEHLIEELEPKSNSMLHRSELRDSSRVEEANPRFS